MNYQITKNLLLTMTLILFAACGGGGGGGGGGTGGGTPAPSGSVTITPSTTGHFYGLVSPATPKAQSFTLTNTGTKTSNSLSLTGLPGSFALSANTCTGATLAPNASCSFTITMTIATNTSVTGLLTISNSGGVNQTIRLAGKATDFQTTSNDLAEMLLVNQANDGSWNDGVGFDMGTTLLAAHSLVKNKAKTNYAQDLFSGFGNLTKTINYLSATDDDGNGTPGEPTDSDGTLDPIDFSADKERIIDEWARTMPVGGMKVKEVLPSFPLTLESLVQLRDSTNSSIFAYTNDYLTSRRMTATTGSMMAQYSYMMDYNRWVAFYGAGYLSSNLNEVIELQLKDVYLLLTSLIEQGRTTEAQELSKAILLNFLSNSTEIFDETGIVMRYSTAEFNHSSFTNALLDEPLFSRVNTCRMNSYVLLLVSLALENGNFTELNTLFNNANLKQDLTNSIKNFFWPSLKSTWIDDLSSDNRNNCLPIAALAAAKAPRSAVTPDTVVSLYNEFFTRANNLEYDPSAQGSVLILMEALESIAAMVNN